MPDVDPGEALRMPLKTARTMKKTWRTPMRRFAEGSTPQEMEGAAVTLHAPPDHIHEVPAVHNRRPGPLTA